MTIAITPAASSYSGWDDLRNYYDALSPWQTEPLVSLHAARGYQIKLERGDPTSRRLSNLGISRRDGETVYISANLEFFKLQGPSHTSYAERVRTGQVPDGEVEVSAGRVQMLRRQGYEVIPWVLQSPTERFSTEEVERYFRLHLPVWCAAGKLTVPLYVRDQTDDDDGLYADECERYMAIGRSIADQCKLDLVASLRLTSPSSWNPITKDQARICLSIAGSADITQIWTPASTEWAVKKSNNAAYSLARVIVATVE